MIFSYLCRRAIGMWTFLKFEICRKFGGSLRKYINNKNAAYKCKICVFRVAELEYLEGKKKCIYWIVFPHISTTFFWLIKKNDTKYNFVILVKWSNGKEDNQYVPTVPSMSIFGIKQESMLLCHQI